MTATDFDRPCSFSFGFDWDSDSDERILLIRVAVAGTASRCGVCSGWAFGFHTRFVYDWLFVQRWLGCIGNFDHVPVGTSFGDCSVSSGRPGTSIVAAGFPVPTLIAGHEISDGFGNEGRAIGSGVMSGPGKGDPLTPL